MLYIKNGRLYTQSYSYIVPDELCLIPDTFETSPDTITLETLDGKFQLMIRPYDTEKTPLEELSSMLEYCGHVKMSEILDIDRGGMIGKGVFSIVEDAHERERGFITIMKHYTGRTDWTFDESLMKRTAIYRLDVREWSCKEHE